MYKNRMFKDSDYKQLESIKLRPADEQELVTATGLSVVDGLKESINHSTWTGVIEDEGKIIMLYGLATSEWFGIPWMMCTDEAYRYQYSLVKWGKEIVAEMLNQTPYLSNIVDARNEVHIKWLKWMGFTFTGNEFEINGYPFLHFVMRREDV